MLVQNRETNDKVWHWLHGNFSTAAKVSDGAAATELEHVLVSLRCKDSVSELDAAASLPDEGAYELHAASHSLASELKPPAGLLAAQGDTAARLLT